MQTRALASMSALTVVKTLWDSVA